MALSEHFTVKLLEACSIMRWLFERIRIRFFFILPSVPDQPFLGLRIRIPVNLKPDPQSFSAMNVFKQLSF